MALLCCGNEVSPEHLKLTKEHVTKTEKEIETADKTAVSSNIGSYKLCPTAPKSPNAKIVRGLLHSRNKSGFWAL